MQERGSIYTKGETVKVEERQGQEGQRTTDQAANTFFLLIGKELSLGPAEQPALPQCGIKIYHLAHREQAQRCSDRPSCSFCCNLGIC